MFHNITTWSIDYWFKKCIYRETMPNIYATCELTGNYKYHMYTLQTAVHHIVICLWINIATTSYIYVFLHCGSSLHVDLKESVKRNYTIYSTCYCHICTSYKYTYQMVLICHACKLVGRYIWGNIPIHLENMRSIEAAITIHILYLP